METQTVVPKAPPSEYYEIRPAAGKGFGCFALKPIKRGTRILADDPLLVVPKGKYLKRDIEAAFGPLTPEQKALYFTLHSNHGQDPKKWPKQIHSSVSPGERQRIEEQHEARLADAPSLISIFQTNCMEWNDGAAVFAHASRFNHCCNPNACFHWNEVIGKETVHVISDVAAGEEITLSYCDNTFDRHRRAWELRHYGFVCDCRACNVDELEDENSFAYQSAQRRFSLQELDLQTQQWRGQRLDEGAKQENFVNKLLQMCALHVEEGNYNMRLGHAYMDIALLCERHGDLKMAFKAAIKAAAVKKVCQGTDCKDYHQYAEAVTRIRTKLGDQEK